MCESTGVFWTAGEIRPHLKYDPHTVGMSVNQETYTADRQAVSCASWTTNGLAPMV